MCPVGILWEHGPRSGYIEGTWQMIEQHAGNIKMKLVGIWWEHFGNIFDNILNVIWWIHLGDMLRLHLRCSLNVIDGYIWVTY